MFCVFGYTSVGMRTDAGVFRELAIWAIRQIEGELFIPHRKKTARVSMDYRLPPPLGNGTFHLRLLIKTLRESV